MPNQPTGGNCEKIAPGTPPDVWNWLFSPAANSELKSNPKTIQVPPDVFSWYTATASAFYAGCPLPVVVETGVVIPSASSTPIATTAGIPNLVTTDSTPTDTPLPAPSPNDSTTSAPSFTSTDLPQTGITQASPTLHDHSSSPSKSGPPAATTNAAKSHSRTQAAPVAAGIIAALVFIAISAGAFRYYKRRQRAKEQRESFGETGTFLKL